ncbi:MAG: protein translocase subunit SecD [Acidobacteria bacterium]|nr:protein translocase subunit SecD [Acidobacteriota bacterium]MBI3657516.1 protein translocase subunit SecD [Acidobacteriota bacterium]
MNKRLRYRIIISAILVVVCAYYGVYPNLLPALLKKATPEAGKDATGVFTAPPINLGLDLQGGTHLRLEVDTGDALAKELDHAVQRTEIDFREKNIPYDYVRRPNNSDRSFQISNVPSDKDIDARAYLDQSYKYNYSTSTSTQAGRVTYTLTMEPAYARREMENTVRSARDVIDRRVNELGVSEPIIQIYGRNTADQVANQIIVELAGVNPERAKKIIQETAQLEFRLVHPDKQHHFPSREEAIKSFPNGILPPEYDVLPYSGRDSHSGNGTPSGGWYVVRRTAAVTGKHLKTARPQPDPNRGSYEVVFTLTREGREMFTAVTGQNTGKQLAIILDRKVHSAPVIKERIPSDEATISGTFTPEEATDLALILRSGALPAKLRIIEERTVGASLGADSIRAGITGSLIGFVLVVLVMLVYYHWSGVNAVGALIINLIMLLAFMGKVGATLTLPGIAGIALTVGMAVDSNILIFERIREELRLGKTIKFAVGAGFDRVYWTIFDTHTTAIISAIFLIQFGTGPIRGFGVTLIAGLVANLITSIFISRVVFETALATRPVSKLSI